MKTQVIMDPVPEPELPAMVDYTPEVFIAYPSLGTSFLSGIFWLMMMMLKSYVTES